THPEALLGAHNVITRLGEEVERLGLALEAQRERYERTLSEERAARRLGQEARLEELLAEVARLEEENARLARERDAARWSQRRAAASLRRLREEYERAAHAYRASLSALRLAFEKQLRVA